MYKSFPFERIIEINDYMIESVGGLRGSVDLNKLKGALYRVDNFVIFEGSIDAFDIAAKYAAVIAISHSFSDANKRTGLAVAIEFLLFNDYKITQENILFSDAMVKIVTGEITEKVFSDCLYSQYISQNKNL